MIIVSTVTDLHAALALFRANGKTIGFVPTMGALHDGHLSLVNQSKLETDVTCVSIFVNPKQFGPSEDFDRYPRTVEADCALLKTAGVELVFSPKVSDIYPDTDVVSLSHYDLPEMAEWYCGKTRPQFFKGVCEVVQRLFAFVTPDRAFFGEKDYQQLTIISDMARTLSLPIRVVGCPILREPSGLAMSSRNRYLSSDDQVEATTIYRSFMETRRAWMNGISDTTVLLDTFFSHLSIHIAPDYCVIVDPLTLVPQPVVRVNDRMLFAGTLRSTRLIDNIAF